MSTAQFDSQRPGNQNESAGLNYQELLSRNLIEELANLFDKETDADMFLDIIRFPGNKRPQFDVPINFWREICRQIDKGLLPGGFESMLEQVARSYPGNQVFREWANQKQRKTGYAAPASETGVNVYLSGWNNGNLSLSELISQVNQCATAAGIAEEIQLSYCRGDLISYYIISGDVNTAARLRDALMSSRQPGSEIQVSVGYDLGFRDYLLSRIYVEGPDQGRFQFSNIPASTTIQEIGNAMVDQYEGSWPRDSDNSARNVVVDHVGQDGTTERVNSPNSTLHDNGIRDNDALQVNPESIAAAINPQIRQVALARVKLEIMEFSKSNPQIKIAGNSASRPFEYVIHFEANGWAPGPSVKAGPVKRRDHEVSVFFDSDFPVSAPVVQWLTPFFHPNVDAKSGSVCLGELKDLYRPSLHIGKLCLIILDIANYRNYQVISYFNEAAATWAASAEGQREIAEQGGRLLPEKEKPVARRGFLNHLSIQKI